MTDPRTEEELKLIDHLIKDGARRTAAQLLREVYHRLHPPMPENMKLLIVCGVLAFVIILILISAFAGALYACARGDGILTYRMQCQGYEIVDVEKYQGRLIEARDRDLYGINTSALLSNRSFDTGGVVHR